MKTNKTAVLTALQTIEVQETSMPAIGPDDVLVKMEYCGVCGSDVEFFAHGCIGTNQVKYPFVLGHEVSGIIDAVGENVKHVQVGQPVVIEPGIPCGHCEFCRQGRYNICASMKFMSSPPYDGLLSKYVAVPGSTVSPIPAGVSTKTAALVEPLAVGMHAAKLGDVKAPKTVVILGGGCIGLCTLLSCKQLGASRIIVSDLFQNRLDVAKELGAEIVNASECNAVEKILEMTNGEGADVVLETAGSKITASQTTLLMRRGGTIVIVGNVLGDVPFNFRNIARTEGTVKVARRYCNDFQACLGAIANGGIPAEKLERIVDAVYDFEQSQEAFERSLNDKQNITKVVIKIAD
jgi:L-iditol 2-dehydrogenase